MKIRKIGEKGDERSQVCMRRKSKEKLWKLKEI